MCGTREDVSALKVYAIRYVVKAGDTHLASFLLQEDAEEYIEKHSTEVVPYHLFEVGWEPAPGEAIGLVATLSEVES